ncbi:MAG: dihydrolipoamide acetyltransferase family protein [Gemmataceae bacterium]
MDFKLPELGEGVYEAELVAWLVKPGDAVKRGQNLMEVLTDKATMEVPAAFRGTIRSLHAEPGQKVKVGDVVLVYDDGVAEGQAASETETRKHGEGEKDQTVAASPHRRVTASSAPAASPRQRVTASSAAVKAAPSVRLMARKLGVDLTRVPGSGPGGRILIDDLSQHVQPGNGQKREAEVPVDYGTPGTTIKLIGLRRKIAEHMVLAKRTIPHYSYVDECDVTDLVKIRASLKERFTRAGTRLTYLAFFVKAVTVALKEVPLVNASLDDEAGAIILHDHYHVGVATATPGGLIVPVVHDADRKDLLTIARDIERLSGEARAGKIKREDLHGATFTVTSVGNIGGLISTPVIDHPQVGILGVGKVVRRPVYDEQGQIRPADLIYLSFSFDHRVLDGAVGAAFGNAVKRELQAPAGLLLPA